MWFRGRFYNKWYHSNWRNGTRVSLYPDHRARFITSSHYMMINCNIRTRIWKEQPIIKCHGTRSCPSHVAPHISCRTLHEEGTRVFSSAGSMLRGEGMPVEVTCSWARTSHNWREVVKGHVSFSCVLLPNCSAFGCAVECAWSATTSHTEPLHRLSYKLRHTAKELKRWIKSTYSEARLKFHMANDVIGRFDVA